jgi:hypothetical protein
MWVRFLRAYDFDPPERGGRVTISYPAGLVTLVRRCCAAAAIAVGAAEPAERPQHDDRRR